MVKSMKINVRLRYLTDKPVEIVMTQEVEDHCSMGNLRDIVINTHMKKADIHFTGANIAVLVNGRLASDDLPLHDGDEVRIFPVAAGG